MLVIPTKLLFIFLSFNLLFQCANHPTGQENPERVQVGASDYTRYLPLLQGKKVGLFANHTAIFQPDELPNPLSSSQSIRTVDLLIDSGIQVERIFAPEHGAMGKAPDGAKIGDIIDPVLKIPVVSLYGKKKKPLPEDLKDLDIIVFDIQDVGVRAYTYISSLLLMMEACAQQKLPLVVLDRPNPNTHLLDGPMLDTKFRSFVGMIEIPWAYGMTIGELALMMNGEGWAGNPNSCDLTVISCRNYTHKTNYRLPINPSPNLEGTRSVLLYPSLCFFEGTTLSIGRGTDHPFQMLGHPELKKARYPYTFTPRSVPASPKPKHEGFICNGIDFRDVSVDSLYKKQTINLELLVNLYQDFPKPSDYFRTDGYFDKLAGTDQLRLQLQSGKTAREIRESWQADLDSFKELRSKYLIYAD